MKEFEIPKEKRAYDRKSIGKKGATYLFRGPFFRAMKTGQDHGTHGIHGMSD
jgi:hypothetical protein